MCAAPAAAFPAASWEVIVLSRRYDVSYADALAPDRHESSSADRHEVWQLAEVDDHFARPRWHPSFRTWRSRLTEYLRQEEVDVPSWFADIVQLDHEPLPAPCAVAAQLSFAEPEREVRTISLVLYPSRPTTAAARASDVRPSPTRARRCARRRARRKRSRSTSVRTTTARSRAAARALNEWWAARVRARRVHAEGLARQRIDLLARKRDAVEPGACPHDGAIVLCTRARAPVCFHDGACDGALGADIVLAVRVYELFCLQRYLLAFLFNGGLESDVIDYMRHDSESRICYRACREWRIQQASVLLEWWGHQQATGRGAPAVPRAR